MKGLGIFLVAVVVPGGAAAYFAWRFYGAAVRMSVSDTAKKLGLDNLPPVRLWPRLWKLDRIAARVTAALHAAGHTGAAVTSAYRTPALNAALPGSVPDSFHLMAGPGQIALDYGGFGGAPPPAALDIIKHELASAGVTARVTGEKDHAHLEGTV